MESSNKQKKFDQYAHPHIGSMIERQMRARRLTKADMARRVGVSQSSFSEYLNQNSVQFRILWKIGLALEYNFLADLMQYLPLDVLNSSKSSFQETIASQEKEIADLKKEIEIYKGILKR